MMKYAGQIILIASSSITGLLLCERQKKKISVCADLIRLCDMLLLDLSYRITPATELLSNALKSDGIGHLDFISTEFIKEKAHINSVLSKQENEEISRFLYSLGKTDVASQKKLILSFREYINNALKAYSEKHKRDSKLYVSFGLFFGIVFSLIWS